MWSNIFRVILESTWHKITFWSHFWNCSLLFFLIMGLLPTSLFWKHCLLVPIHEAVSRHCACFIPCPWGKWAMCGQRQWLKFQPWPLFICLQNRSEVYCSLWVCFSYLTIMCWGKALLSRTQKQPQQRNVLWLISVAAHACTGVKWGLLCLFFSGFATPLSHLSFLWVAL